jgi:hypothetical protein
LLYNTNLAEETPTIQVYKSFLISARSLLSDLKENIEEKRLIEVTDVRLKAVLENL